jgi:hypothetical protein
VERRGVVDGTLSLLDDGELASLLDDGELAFLTSHIAPTGVGVLPPARHTVSV